MVVLGGLRSPNTTTSSLIFRRIPVSQIVFITV